MKERIIELQLLIDEWKEVRPEHIDSLNLPYQKWPQIHESTFLKMDEAIMKASELIDHLTAEREMKEHNIRELLIHFIDSIRDYESESHNNIGFDDRESDELVDIYLKHNPEILSHHLTAEQGDGHTLCGINCDRTDCKATIIPWCELKDFPCDKSPRQEPPELTVREVVEWCAEKQGCEINYGEIYDSNLKPIALDELTKIIRHGKDTNRL